MFNPRVGGKKTPVLVKIKRQLQIYVSILPQPAPKHTTQKPTAPLRRS